LENRTLLSFLPAVNYPAGSGPSAVAVRDFNGDRIPDLVVANYNSRTVSVILGNGDGTFQAAQSYDCGFGPSAVAVGDFNGDGTPDLAVTNGSFPVGTVSILLGNGDGTFQSAASYIVDTGPSAVAVGDFNGDGTPDLAVTNGSFPVGTVSILLGNGDGTFQPAQSYAVGYQPSAVALADCNGDGILDLVVANYGSGTIAILLGNGEGSFPAPQNSSVGGRPRCVAVGDFNGDGIPDLAVANVGSNSVSILLGNGDGTFQGAHDYAAGAGPVAVAVGDFNGDRSLDLVVANIRSHTMSILLGNGDGTFQAADDDRAGTFPLSVAVVDFNGDGFPDLAVANTGSGSVSVLLNAADWGGPGLAPPPGPALHRPVPIQPQIEPVAGSLTATKPQADPVCSSPTTEFPPSPVRQCLVEAKTGQSDQHEATFTPRPRVTTQHAQDAVFERWGNVALGVLARNMWG
jgi:hypothetical protein